jgi:dipeptidyl aminopeptidase/acylaminoacyl peptidase
MGQPLFSGPNYLESIWDKSSFRIIGVRYAEGLLSRARYYDEEMNTIQSRLEGALAGLTIDILATSTDRQKILFEARGPSRSPALAVFDATVPSIMTVAEQHPEVAQTALGEVSNRNYTAENGSRLGGILILPPGGATENLPTVILDDTRTGLEFDVFAHFLASRGYAVFRPGVQQAVNFGDLSRMGELEDWIANYQNSVMCGLNHLVESGITDPERVCIIGTGESGYAALMTVAAHADAFKCAVGVNGMYDLERTVDNWKLANTTRIAAYYYALARNYDNFDEADLARYSPVNHGDDIAASVLIIGDDRDGGNSAMVNALERADKNVVYTELIDNWNGPAEARLANEQTEYSATEAFLAQNIGR